MKKENCKACYIAQDQLQYFASVLEEKKKRLCNQIDYGAKSLKNYSDYSQMDDALMHCSEAEKELKEIQDALLKIKNGDYGYCEESGEEIGIKRLKANPTARYCVNIQEEFDTRNHLKKITNHTEQG